MPRATSSPPLAARADRRLRLPCSRSILNRVMHPFLNEVMNATGVAFDREGNLYVSSRMEGSIYKVTPSGQRSTYAQGMGVATGIAFDRDENLYVGDRTGTIFKISPDRQIFVFATIEPSVAAYHLAFSPAGDLYCDGAHHFQFRSRACASLPAGESRPFIEAWDGRRDWRLTSRAIFM